MRSRILFLATMTLLLALPMPAVAQQTPPSMVATYDALADAIIGMLDTEEAFVRSLLDGHLHAAQAAVEEGDWEMAAGHMALFANEGDNAIAGIRKRLLDAGHHHHAEDTAHHAEEGERHHAEEDEEGAVYPDGYVVVTVAARERLLEATSELRRATDGEGRMAAWEKFQAIARELLEAA